MNNTTSNVLVSIEEAKEMIRRGETLSIAGSEALLDQLPQGNWIGGTTSYFMAEEGGVRSSDCVFVSHLPNEAPISFASYQANNLHDIMKDAPENGFSLTIMPSGSETLQRFSEESRYWDEVHLKPVVGWIAGIDLTEIGQTTAKAYLGSSLQKIECGAVVAHVSLPPHQVAMIESVNIFERDESSVIRFDITGSKVSDCTVDGQKMRFIDFLESKGNADGTLPLIGDFSGANINVSIQNVDKDSGTVALYAPVFPDIEYYLAHEIDDYASRFKTELDTLENDGLVFSCNCILNYLNGKLEGKKTGEMQGPITFGEVAYLLHNQTMVTLRVV